MKLSRKLQKALVFFVTALTTTLLFISVASLTFAQNRIPAPETFPAPTTTPAPETLPAPPPRSSRQKRQVPCTPEASNPSAWLLPVPANKPPVAKNDEYRVLEEKPIAVNVLDNDTDPNCDRLTVTKVTQGNYGKVEINPDGTINYTVTTLTVDNFVYTISDGKGGIAEATVTITD